MKIFFGGVRGSAPRAAPRFTEYGGHTTCLLVSGVGGELMMLDGGSGVQEVNMRLASAESRDLTVLMTHLHLDHLLGLPMLLPLYDDQWRIRIAAVPRGEPLASSLDRIMTPPLWPIPLSAMSARIEIEEIDDGGLSLPSPVLVSGGLEVRGVEVSHPNGCTAWRVDEPATGASMVLATDVEWSAAGENTRTGLIDLCRDPGPARLLVMDGQFSAEELPEFSGWGHSSPAECMEVAAAAGVERLLITHHGPDCDDARLDDMESAVCRLSSSASLARQGETITLSE